MDWSILHTLNGFLAHHDAVEDPYADYVRFSELLFLGLLAWIFVASRGYTRRAARRGAVAAGLSAGVSLVIASQLATLVGRPRPFVDEPHTVHLLVAHAADPGFPSDHATAAFAIAVAILLRNRRWGLLALVMAIALAVGRVAVGVHFPSDVLAGAALGSATALLLYLPPVRRPLHRLADWAGGVWDGATSALVSAARS
jgi:undecaprenyl-diphosphatase